MTFSKLRSVSISSACFLILFLLVPFFSHLPKTARLTAFTPLSTTVFAAGDFIVDYNVNYVVSSQGVTTVVQNISLLNRQTNLFAKEYSIVIDSTKIKNVT